LESQRVNSSDYNPALASNPTS